MNPVAVIKATPTAQVEQDLVYFLLLEMERLDITFKSTTLDDFSSAHSPRGKPRKRRRPRPGTKESKRVRSRSYAYLQLAVSGDYSVLSKQCAPHKNRTPSRRLRDYLRRTVRARDQRSPTWLAILKKVKPNQKMRGL